MQKSLTYIPTEVSPICENCNMNVSECNRCGYLFKDGDIIYCDDDSETDTSKVEHLCEGCGERCADCGKKLSDWDTDLEQCGECR